VPPPVQREEITVTVIPSLPDPNNGKVYNLQVGAFSRLDTASEIAIRVRNAGFDVFQEFTGSTYRVLVKDIPASMVFSAAQRLGTIGFREIWLRETR
jgi:cell division septation protein DedD